MRGGQRARRLLVSVRACVAIALLQITDAVSRAIVSPHEHVQNSGALVAIATTLYLRPDASHMQDYESTCGIVKWCRDAVRFAGSLPALVAGTSSSQAVPWYAKVDVVVSTNNVSFTRRECDEPSVLIVPIEEELMRLAVKYGALALHRSRLGYVT